MKSSHLGGGIETLRGAPKGILSGAVDSCFDSCFGSCFDSCFDLSGDSRVQMTIDLGFDWKNWFVMGKVLAQNSQKGLGQDCLLEGDQSLECYLISPEAMTLAIDSRLTTTDWRLE